jgi:predicted ATPase
MYSYTSNAFTEDDLKATISSIFYNTGVYIKDPTRCFVFTGEEGHKAINDAVETQLYKDTTKILLDRGLVNKVEYLNLIKMLDSMDPENITIAKLIINKKEEYDKIYNRKSPV